MSALSTLARLARRGPKVEKTGAGPEGPACELCAAPAGPGHGHVVELESGGLRCACLTCARLFAHPGAAARFRTVPDRVVEAPGPGPLAAEWEALAIPVRLAFVVRSSRRGRWIASYPGPAGTVEGELAEDAWARLAARLPLAAELEPDVEALLFHGERGARHLACLLVPVDACYALAGRLRRAWRGFDGGTEARAEIAASLAALRARVRPRRAGREEEARP